MTPAASWLLLSAIFLLAVPATYGLLTLMDRLSDAYLIRWINGAALSWDEKREREDVS